MEVFSHRISWDREPENLPAGWAQCSGTFRDFLVSISYSGCGQKLAVKFTETVTFKLTTLPLISTDMASACKEVQNLINEAVCNDGKVWISVKDSLPDAGDYFCKVSNNGREFEAQRRLVRKSHAHAWFGGARPFADDDVVTHYRLNLF
ncbi:hypothetical protein [Vibrio coralliilyticus]|uniref:hypothetical protein n=1 Tax=Vibrio coralliilyticus TaxID=190893 RepID=UPI000BAC1F23|nr:hypothetical protein [Vibrio coralliilyticus]PAW02231.1 hypothetical protein CKJ79_16350 [Vibrio coralliilyticus]